MLNSFLQGICSGLTCLPPDLFIALPYLGRQPGGGEVDPCNFSPLSFVFQSAGRKVGSRVFPSCSPTPLGF